MLTRILGIIVLLFVSGCATTIVEKYAPATYGSHAFSGINDQSEDYTVGVFDCTVTLVPPRVEEASSANTTNWFNVLSAAYPVSDGWTYQSAIDNLSNNSLEIKTYDAQGAATFVGSDVHIRYVPGNSDPKRGIHWIQVVKNNHRINPSMHGTPDNKVDTYARTGMPYYDDGGAADFGNCDSSCNFYDKPRRTDPVLNHDWDALLYVVEAPAAGPGRVTLRAPAMSWGWKNECTIDLPILDWWLRLLDGYVSLNSDGPIVADSSVQLNLEGEARFRLMQGELESTVSLTDLQLALDIGPQTEPISAEANIITFSTEGSGTFSDFTLGDEEFRGAQLVLSGGNGVIHSNSGGISASIDGEIVAENQDSMPITMYLYGQLGEENYSVSLTAETTMIVPRN
jgi:hypothetical protein